MSLLEIQSPATTVPKPRLARVLVHLPESDCAETLMRFTVNLAINHDSLLRGLMVVDTTRFEDTAATCEAGVYALYELDRLYAHAPRRREIIKRFSSQCGITGVEYEVLEREGIPADIVLAEATSCDLAVTAVSPVSVKARNGEIAARDLTDVILKSNVPFLILRASSERPKRVLLVDDGTHSSRRAISSFLSSDLFSDSAVTLLAVAPSAELAKARLSETRENIQLELPDFEIDFVVGEPRNVIPSYLKTSNTELAVLGVEKQAVWKRLLFGDTLTNVVKQTECAIYGTT